jgi:serine/threonine protein kinase
VITFQKDEIIDNRFRIIETVGKSESCMVFKASDTQRVRNVCLKFYSGEERSLEAFFNKITLAAIWSHPYILNLQEAFAWKNGLVVVCEFVEGRRLAEMIESKVLPIVIIVDWLLEITRGVEFLHRKNLYHGRLHPNNILVNPKGNLKILDVEKTLVRDQIAALKFQNEEYSFYFRSFRDAAPLLEARLDIYAIGALFYSLILGRLITPESEALLRPFLEKEGNIFADDSDVPAIANTIIHKCLETDEHLAYSSISDLIYDLEKFRLAEPFALLSPKLIAETKIEELSDEASTPEYQANANRASQEKSGDLCPRLPGLEVSHSAHAVTLPDDDDLLRPGFLATLPLESPERAPSFMVEFEPELPAPIGNIPEASADAPQRPERVRERTVTHPARAKAASALKNGPVSASPTPPVSHFPTFRKLLWSLPHKKKTLIFFYSNLGILAIAFFCMVFTYKTRVFITSFPNRAHVSVDQVQIGATPLAYSDIRFMHIHSIVITKDGYEPIVKTLIGGVQNSNLFFPLIPLKGLLTVSSVPDSEVFVNDKLIGKTPIENFPQPWGSYEITIRANDTFSIKKKIDIAKGEKKFVRNIFPGMIAFSGDYAYNLKINGEDKGLIKTPLEYRFERGTYHILMERNGYTLFDRDVPLKAGDVVRITAPPVGYIQLNLKPPVRVDLEDQAGFYQTIEATPAHIALPPGKYTMTVSYAKKRIGTEDIRINLDKESIIDRIYTAKVFVRIKNSSDRVFIDDQRTEVNPRGLVNLPLGSHTIRVMHNNCPSETRAFELNQIDQIVVQENFSYDCSR